MIIIAEAIEDAADQAALEEIKRTAVKQLRMIVVGVAGWRSDPDGDAERPAETDPVQENPHPPSP